MGECYQWMAIEQRSKRDSCGFRHNPQRQEGQWSSLAPKAKAQTDGQIPLRSGSRGESPSGTRRETPCRNFFRESVRIRIVITGTPPVRLNCKSESECAETDWQPSKKPKKNDVKGSVAHYRSLHNWVLCLEILIRVELLYLKREIGIKSTFPRARGTTKKPVKKRSIAGVNQSRFHFSFVFPQA